MPEILLQQCEEAGSRTAVIAAGEGRESSRTYAHLAQRSRKLSGRLASIGIGRGSRVGGLLANGLEFLETWFATTLLGAVFVPFNTALKGSLLNYQILDSSISALFFDSRLNSNLEGIKISPDVTTVCVDNSGAGMEPDAFEYSSFMDQGDEIDKMVHIEPSDTATLLYTSGTTNSPKGVELSHAAYVNRTIEMSDLFKADRGDVFLNTLPMFHTSGQVMTVLPAFLNGGTVVIEEWFHASRFWRSAAKCRAKFSFLLMTMINSLLRRKEEFVEGPLEVVLCGGATAAAWREFETSFKVKLLEGFGMTETCGVAIFNRQDHFRVGSIGTPLPSVEVAILDESDVELPSSEKGEICLREKLPHTLMSKYYNLPNETNLIMKNGWLHTGDLGYHDDEGFFYFVERKKDIIRRRGENISPSDIERVVSTYDGIIENCSVGIPSPMGEEDIGLYLVLKEESTIDYLNFLKWLDAQLPFYMMPRYITVVRELPKTANHKIQRAKLREQKDVKVISTIDVEKLGFIPTKPSIR